MLLFKLKSSPDLIEEPRGESDDLARRPRTLVDMFFLSEENDETYQDDPGSERENSDFDGEEDSERGQIVNWETSISKASSESSSCQHEGPVRKVICYSRFLFVAFKLCHYLFVSKKCNNILLTLLHHCPLWIFSLFLQPIDVAIDMKQRYIGHCNIGTDIKQASFLGQQGRHLTSVLLMTFCNLIFNFII